MIYIYVCVGVVWWAKYALGFIIFCVFSSPEIHRRSRCYHHRLSATNAWRSIRLGGLARSQLKFPIIRKMQCMIHHLHLILAPTGVNFWEFGLATSLFKSLFIKRKTQVCSGPFTTPSPLQIAQSPPASVPVSSVAHDLSALTADLQQHREALRGSEISMQLAALHVSGEPRAYFGENVFLHNCGPGASPCSLRCFYILLQYI